MSDAGTPGPALLATRLLAMNLQRKKREAELQAAEAALAKERAIRVESLPVKLTPDRQRRAEGVQARIADYTIKYKLPRGAIRRALVRVVEATPRTRHGGHYLNLVERDGTCALVSHANYLDLTRHNGWRGLGSFCTLHDARVWCRAAGLIE